MEINRIINIIRMESMNYGVKAIVRDSKSSNSYYIKLCAGKNEMLIRLSDHNSFKSIATLRFDRVQNDREVYNFIHSKINDLSHRGFRHFIGR